MYREVIINRRGATIVYPKFIKLFLGDPLRPCGGSNRLPSYTQVNHALTTVTREQAKGCLNYRKMLLPRYESIAW